MTTDVAIKLAQRLEAEFDLVVKRPERYPANISPVWKLFDATLESVDREASTKDSTQNGLNNSLPTQTGLQFLFDRLGKWNGEGDFPFVKPADIQFRQAHDYNIRALEFAQIARIMMIGGRSLV